MGLFHVADELSFHGARSSSLNSQLPFLQVFSITAALSLRKRASARRTSCSFAKASRLDGEKSGCSRRSRSTISTSLTCSSAMCLRYSAACARVMRPLVRARRLGELPILGLLPLLHGRQFRPALRALLDTARGSRGEEG